MGTMEKITFVSIYRFLFSSAHRWQLANTLSMLWSVQRSLRFQQRFSSSIFFDFVQRRASASPSSTAVASTVNQRNVPQTKSGQFGVPQRINLPKESVHVRSLSI